MNRITKTLLILIAILAIILCILCCLYIYQYHRGAQVHQALSDVAMSAPAPVEVPVPEEPEELPTDEPAVEAPIPEVVPGEPEDEETIDSSMIFSIDFDGLKAINEEIYAWIVVPGTDISYAIVQSETDDLFYNTHGINGAYFSGGSIFTQRYNTKTFEDAMTLVYGHNFHDQSLFAPLLNFMDADFFAENRHIYIYTADTIYDYEIFAAYPHTSEHLLLCYDFDDKTDFYEFYDKLSGNIINANFDRNLFPEFEDKVLTLSTCFRLTFGQRYLVQGVLRATHSYDKETD